VLERLVAGSRARLGRWRPREVTSSFTSSRCAREEGGEEEEERRERRDEREAAGAGTETEEEEEVRREESEGLWRARRSLEAGTSQPSSETRCRVSPSLAGEEREEERRARCSAEDWDSTKVIAVRAPSGN